MPAEAARSSRWAWGAFAVVAAAAALTIAHFAEGRTFFYDEWGVILYRRSGGVAAFLAPLNGHLLAAPIVVYRALFAIVGLRSYTPYTWVTIAAHLLLMALVFAYVRRRQPWPVALLCVIPLLLLGRASEVLLWMMNLGFIFPMVALLGILLLADQADRAATVGKAVLLLLALASSGLGIAVAMTTAVDTALRRRWRELPWLAAPVVLYLIWFVAYRPTANTPSGLRSLPGANPTGDVGLRTVTSAPLGSIPTYTVKLIESAASGLLGAAIHWWWALLVLLLIGGGLIARRRLSARFVAVAAGAVCFWIITALARAQFGDPAASRYVYPGAVFLVLLTAEAWAGPEFQWRRGRRRHSYALAAVACAGAGLAVVMVSNVRQLHYAQGTRAFAAMEVKLARLQCPHSRLSPTYAPDPATLPNVKLDLYRAAVRDLGSPVPGHLTRALC